MNLLIFSCLLFVSCLVTGNPLFKPETRIFGGEDAQHGEFPFIVSLRVFDDHLCGGSIINKRWVLTAAHCILRIHHTAIDVIAASIDSTKIGEIYRCEDKVVHEKYRLVGYDIGLLRVDKDFNYSNLWIKTIPLDFSFPYENTPVTAMGWGSNYAFPNGTTISTTPILQKWNTIVLDDSQCGYIVEGEMCVRHLPYGSLCSGDSGSPVIAYNKQIGIVSRLNGDDCTDGSPGILTRIHDYQDWIMENTDSW